MTAKRGAEQSCVGETNKNIVDTCKRLFKFAGKHALS